MNKKNKQTVDLLLIERQLAGVRGNHKCVDLWYLQS